MIKNKLAIFTALAISVSSVSAFAQNDGGGSMRGPGQGGGGGQDRQQRFEARKAEILARLQQSESCVKAATDPESLRACMPNRGGRGGGMQDQQSGGGEPQDQQGGGSPQGQQGEGGAMGGGMGSGDAPPPPSDGNAD